MESPNLPSGWPCPPWTQTQRGTPPSEMCVTGWTSPQPTPPRLHQALPQPGAPRHPEDPDPLKPAHCEHFPLKQTSPMIRKSGTTHFANRLGPPHLLTPWCAQQSAVCLTRNPRNGPDRESQVPTARTPRTTRATVAESVALIKKEETVRGFAL